MTHLPFVATAYALGILVPMLFGASAWQRLRLARRRLSVLDKRSAP